MPDKFFPKYKDKIDTMIMSFIQGSGNV